MKAITPSRSITIEEAMDTPKRAENTFTDKFLVQPQFMRKVLDCIGVYEEIEEPIEFQVRTTDDKILDNLVTTEMGTKIAIEAQLYKTDMTHFTKLPYYMSNFLNEPREEIKGILIADSVSQEAINFFELQNKIPEFDLYIVEAGFVQMGENIGFEPKLIYPTPTSNQYKKEKAKQTQSSLYLPNKEQLEKVKLLLEHNNVNYKENDPNKHGAVELRFNLKEYEIRIGVLTSGNVWIAGIGEHENTNVFNNVASGWFKILENGKSTPSTKDVEKIESTLKAFIENV